eukprot:6864010-Prymnesium_polylepis.1
MIHSVGAADPEDVREAERFEPAAVSECLGACLAWRRGFRGEAALLDTKCRLPCKPRLHRRQITQQLQLLSVDARVVDKALCEEELLCLRHPRSIDVRKALQLATVREQPSTQRLKDGGTLDCQQTSHASKLALQRHRDRLAQRPAHSRPEKHIRWDEVGVALCRKGYQGHRGTGYRLLLVFCCGHDGSRREAELDLAHLAGRQVLRRRELQRGERDLLSANPHSEQSITAERAAPALVVSLEKGVHDRLAKRTG